MTDPRAMDCDEIRDLAPLYVLGVLEPDEAAAVRDHLATCDDAHAELLELAEPAGSLLLAPDPADPSPALRTRLMAAAEADLREGRHPATAQPQAHAVTATVEAPEPVDLSLQRERRRFRLASIAAAAAVIVAVALGGYAALLSNQLADADAYREQVDAVLRLAGQPGSATAVLAGEDPGTTGLGAIGADGSVELAIRGLEPTPGREVYTAWAIGADGTPVSLGDFEVGSGGTGIASGTSPVAGAGTVLALTLEPQPGATAPTLPIVASGTATGT